MTLFTFYRLRDSLQVAEISVSYGQSRCKKTSTMACIPDWLLEMIRPQPNVTLSKIKAWGKGLPARSKNRFNYI